MSLVVLRINRRKQERFLGPTERNEGAALRQGERVAIAMPVACILPHMGGVLAGLDRAVDAGLHVSELGLAGGGQLDPCRVLAVQQAFLRMLDAEMDEARR